MNCPRCKIPLLPAHHRRTRVALDVCPRCKGLWFDAGELDCILDVAIKDLHPPEEERMRPTALCLRCNAPMATFHYPQTLAAIDMCPDCHGIWLDANELDEIQSVRRALRRNGLMEEYTRIPGIKGVLIRWIDTAIARLAAEIPL